MSDATAIEMSVPPGAAVSLPGMDVYEAPAAIVARLRTLPAQLISSSYQSAPFVDAFLKAEFGAGTPRLLTINGAGGQPILAWPFIVDSLGPWRVARTLGGGHANFSLPPFDADACAALGGATLRAVLETAIHRAGCDLLMLPHAPLQWDGRPNPFLCLDRRASVNSARFAVLEADGKSSLRALRGKESLRKLSAKRKKLAAMGAVETRLARSVEEKQTLLGDYRRLKDRWSAQRHIANEFSVDRTQAFYAALVLDDSFSMWVVKLGDEVLAMAGGFHDRSHFSLMIIASEQDRYAAFSPGDLLVEQIISDLPAMGVRTVDFGTGEAEYKRRWLPHEMPLADILHAVTFAGQAGVAAISAMLTMKALVKSRPHLAALVHRLRFSLSRS